MPKAFIINASTNKVYGSLESVETKLDKNVPFDIVFSQENNDITV